MSQRGEVQGIITLMKDEVKKVERCCQNVETFYKTEQMPKLAEAAAKASKSGA